MVKCQHLARLGLTPRVLKCGAKQVDAQRAGEAAGTASQIDLRDQCGQRRPVLARLVFERNPELRFQRDTGAVARNRERPLLQPGAWAFRVYVGPTMSSGRTSVSNSAAVTSPDFSASSFRVVPLWCAALAIFAALS